MSDSALERYLREEAECCDWAADSWYEYIIDACLEYWLMRHRADNCGFMPSAELFDPVHGWQCDCLEEK